MRNNLPPTDARGGGLAALLEPADEARIVALQETDERQAAMLADVSRRLALLEAAPPASSGWSYWLHQGLASRKFQAWAVTVLTALGALLSGQIDGQAFLIGVVTATVAWLAAEAAVDSADRAATAKVQAAAVTANGEKPA